MKAPLAHGAATASALLAVTIALLAPTAASGAKARHRASPYPAGAQRPLIRARRSQLGHAAGAGTHAASSRRRAGKPALHGDPARAVVSFDAMQRSYYLLGSGLYKGEPFSYLWPFSQAMAATVTLAEMPSLKRVPSLRRAFLREVHARLIGLRSYLDADNAGAPEGIYTSTLAAFDGTVAPPAGPGGAKYYDDNDWVGIELVRIYKLTREAAVLAAAKQIMAFEMAGWQANPALGCAGGLPFSNTAENTDRNTITTAPAAELALQLYRVTREAQYLQFALSAYEWVRACLLLPGNLYADHVDRHGTVEQTLWSYTQGVMIGAGTLLYQATGDSAYLYQARQTARAALAYFTPERLGEEIPFFPSIYFRNLMYLDSVTHDPPGARLAQSYVDYAWQRLRLADGIFVAGSPPSGQLLVQSAIVQIYGLLSSPASTYF